MTLFIYFFVGWKLKNLITKIHSEAKVIPSDLYNYTLYTYLTFIFFKKLDPEYLNKLKKDS